MNSCEQRIYFCIEKIISKNDKNEQNVSIILKKSTRNVRKKIKNVKNVTKVSKKVPNITKSSKK